MSIRLQQFADGEEPRLPARRPPGRTCVFCGGPMFLDGDRWTCSACRWQMPNRELCPRCWTALPEEEGTDGEKVCGTCGYEFWPPRDGLPEPREIWYHPPGMEPYRVSGSREVAGFGGPPRRGSSGRRSGRFRSHLQRKMDAWRKRRRRQQD